MGIWDFIQDEILGMKWLNRLIGSVLNACGLDTSEKIGGSVQFFIYDGIKIMVLLGVLIFLISYIQSYFPPERTKKILGRFHGIGANCIAALLGEHESAIQDYTEAVRINPKNTNAYYNRGNSYRSLGRYQNAAEDYTAVLRIDPKYANAYFNRAVTHNCLGEFRNAAQDYSEVIRLTPQNAGAYNSHGDARFCLGEYRLAIEDYSEVIRLDPENAIAYNNRGNAYNKLGDRENARADYEKARQPRSSR